MIDPSGAKLGFTRESEGPFEPRGPRFAPRASVASRSVSLVPRAEAPETPEPYAATVSCRLAAKTTSSLSVSSASSDSRLSSRAPRSARRAARPGRETPGAPRERRRRRTRRRRFVRLLSFFFRSFPFASPPERLPRLFAATSRDCSPSPPPDPLDPSSSTPPRRERMKTSFVCSRWSFVCSVWSLSQQDARPSSARRMKPPPRGARVWRVRVPRRRSTRTPARRCPSCRSSRRTRLFRSRSSTGSSPHHASLASTVSTVSTVSSRSRLRTGTARASPRRRRRRRAPESAPESCPWSCARMR